MKQKYIKFYKNVYDVLRKMPEPQKVDDGQLKNNTTKLLDDILNASIGLDHNDPTYDPDDPERGRKFWRKVDFLVIKAKMDGFIIQFHANNKMRKRFGDKLFTFTVRLKHPKIVPEEDQDSRDIVGFLDPMQYLVKIDDYPNEGYTGYFAPKCCYILDKDNNTYKARLNPRDAFRGGFRGLRRLLKWDVLDLLYFAGYAVYNYYLTPYILTFPLMEAREILETYKISYESIPGTSLELPKQGSSKEEYDPFDDIINNPKTQKLEFLAKKYRVLEIKFPDYFPTHCETQTFYVCNEPESKHYNKIEMMEYFPSIGWLISPYFFHFEMDYIKSSGHQVNLIVPYVRRAYIKAESLWIKFVIWLTDAKPPGMFGDIQTITYYNKKINDENKICSLDHTEDNTPLIPTVLSERFQNERKQRKRREERREKRKVKRAEKEALKALKSKNTVTTADEESLNKRNLK